ncbi:hypothetical protein COCON_G00119300 [Conger conger]|uniref:WD repeat-containing protein 1 n=1 Tax=Conger conger TaxID=82655 RepID=A0A9Q1DGF4_CONCO|nr:hypothetical protein COCON_G00119300 [Conger conger]
MDHELKRVFASLPQMERGVAKVIGGDPKGNNFLYTNGKCVIIRDINNPAIADVYTQHAHPVNVAKYAPSGYYIASGDMSGKIRIWDTTQKEHLLKYEYQPLSGPIKDIAWTEDNKRIAVVGQGRGKFTAVFLWDSGSSVGEISGHTKRVNSVDIKQTRPYRLASGSDDGTAAFFEGPPFRWKLQTKENKGFVNCVRFSPDGSRYAAAGSDGKIAIFDGKDSETMIASLGGDQAHKGGIYAVSWSPDSTQLISASGDKTVKLWDVASNTAVTTFNMGSEVNDQQLGCLWQNEHLLSVSLSGYINYLDKNNPDRPLRILKGHSNSVTLKYSFLTPTPRYWDAESGESDGFCGKGHSNQVSKMAVNQSGQLVSCSMDDTVRQTGLDKKDYGASDVVKMDVQPQWVSVGPDGYVVVVCINQLVLLKDGKRVFTLGDLDYDPTAVAVHPANGDVAVGGSDRKVHLYSIQGNTLKDEGKTLETEGAVTDTVYSHDGAFLAASDDKKAIVVFTVAEGYAVKGEFYAHHAKVMCLAWSPDNEHFASGGMDHLVYVWTINDPDKRNKISDAHRLHHISGLAWLDKNTLVTTSHDSCVKQWTIKF